MKLPDWLKHLNGSMDDQGDAPVELLLSANIGYDPKTGNGIDASDFGNVLGSIPKRKEVKLNINSLGGRIDQGMAMYNMIKNHGNVTTCVIGYAASMGAVVHQAGARRQMMPGTCIMIHNPMSTVENGDHREFSAAAERTLQIKSGMVDLLNSTTKIGKKKISDMMDATTFMDHKQALENNFVDEVVDGSPVTNAADPALLANTLRQLSGTPTGSAVDDGGKKTKKEKHTMKLLIASLARLSLLPSPDLTDESAIVTNVETNFAKLNVSKLTSDNAALQTRIDGFETAQKARITNKVDKAIADKVVKADRKETLISMGLRDETELDNYIGDLSEAKASATPARRGAQPVPGANGGGADEKANKMASLRAEMVEKGTTPTRVAEIATELRTLRGHGELFAVAK